MRKVAEDSPFRCQNVTSQGQCYLETVVDDDGNHGKFCMVHGGRHFLEAKKKESMRNYRLTKFQAMLERHADAPGIKSLRDEVAILRILMEERLNKCQDNTDLILQSGPISDLVMKIDKVVSSCHKLEGSMGQLLDKSAILLFASQVIDIIGQVVTDKEQVEEIGARIMKAVGQLSNEENDNEGI